MQVVGVNVRQQPGIARLQLGSRWDQIDGFIPVDAKHSQVRRFFGETSSESMMEV